MATARSFFEDPHSSSSRLPLRNAAGARVAANNRRASLQEQQQQQQQANAAAANAPPVPKLTAQRTDSMSGETGTAVQSICLAAKAVREDRERLANDPDAETIKQERDAQLRAKYEALLRFVPEPSLTERLMTLRRLVLTEGIPPETEDEKAKRDATNDPSVHDVCTLRGTIWKLLLGALHMDAVHYMHLIAEGPTWMDQKIRNDTFRTFQGDEDYWRRVTESHMARVLNAYVRLNVSPPSYGNDESQAGQNEFQTQSQQGEGYVQGMNVLVGPFLYVMPEVDAFICYNRLLSQHIPRYVLKNMEGAHIACSLVEKLLERLDPELLAHLSRNSLSAAVYAFPMVVTMMGMFRPLSSVLKVWDAIFAFGAHFGVILVATQVILMRDTLLAEPHPMKHLLPRTMGLVPLDAEVLVACALAAVKHIPQSLFEDIVRHPVERPIDPTSMLSAAKRTDDRPGSADGMRLNSKRSKDDQATELAPRPRQQPHRNRAMSPVPPKMSATARAPSTARPARPKKAASQHTTGRDAGATDAAKLRSATLNPSTITRLYGQHTTASRAHSKQRPAAAKKP